MTWRRLITKRFWHCYDGEAHEGYGVIEDGELVALAGVLHYGDGVEEIGMDVMPEAREDTVWVARWWGRRVRRLSSGGTWRWRRRRRGMCRQREHCVRPVCGTRIRR